MPRLQQLVLPTPWEVGPVQIYVVLGDPLTLIDTGVKSPASRAALEAAFDALGHGLEEVERVILTHHHGDHLGQAQSLRGAGAELEVWPTRSRRRRLKPGARSADPVTQTRTRMLMVIGGLDVLGDEGG